MAADTPGHQLDELELVCQGDRDACTGPRGNPVLSSRKGVPRSVHVGTPLRPCGSDPTVPAERRESTCSSTFSMLVATLTGMAKMSKKEKDYTRHLDEWIEAVVDLCPDDKITQTVAHMLFLLKGWIAPNLGVKSDLDEPDTYFLSDLCDVGINVDQALAGLKRLRDIGAIAFTLLDDGQYEIRRLNLPVQQMLGQS